MTAIQTEGLQKTYGTVQALAGLDLRVEAGSVFGFLGPNGAGKTTTIRILTGLARATAGRAWVAGRDISTASAAAAADIGYLPEESALYGWMTPVEFLDHVGRLFGLDMPTRTTRTRALLAQVGLAEAGRRRIAGFSRGMRQRLGLAQALINQPRVLFLDEPVSALDPAGRKEVLELIESLRGQCTVFMSTHILADVERVCDTVGIITQGRLAALAPRTELMSRYALPEFELETDEPAARWTDRLNGLAWVRAVRTVEQTTRITVTDVPRAKQELLPAVLAAGVTITRYELRKPSLEDVFLQLVGGPTA